MSLPTTGTPTTDVLLTGTPDRPRTVAGPAQRRRRAFHPGDAIVPALAALAFVFLMVPIVYTVVFSFNDYFKSNLIWNSFTWDNWANPCAAPQVCEAFGTSLQVGAVSTAVATALGTLLAVALVRFRFHGRSAVSLLVFLPMSTPEVVLGSALAAQFLLVHATYGFWTIVAAHVMFCISFVVVTVKARVASLDPALEEAAADLYASPVAAFWRVTFPLLLPGIAAAALLSFSLSFDDYIVTNFNAGSVKTFPMFVYISAQRGIPAQANVLATIMFLLALLAVVVVQVWSVGRRRRQGAVGRRERGRTPATTPTEGADGYDDDLRTTVVARMPARPAVLAPPRTQVVHAAPSLRQTQVAGLSVQGHRPLTVAAVGLAGVVGGVLGVLTALAQIPNAYDGDLRRWLAALGVAGVVAVVSVVLLRGSAVGRMVYAVAMGLGAVGLLLALTVFGGGASPWWPLVGLVVTVACVGVVFTKAANEYFRPSS